MNVYMFQAAFLCESCGEKVCRQFQDGHADMVPDCICGAPFSDHKVDYDSALTVGKLVLAINDDRFCDGYEANEHTYDSDDYPKGPFPDGGGEADSPNHCDECNVFLENPLTSEGMDYVRMMVVENIHDGSHDKDTLAEWIDFYDIKLKDFLKD